MEQNTQSSRLPFIYKTLLPCLSQGCVPLLRASIHAKRRYILYAGGGLLTTGHPDVDNRRHEKSRGRMVLHDVL